MPRAILALLIFIGGFAVGWAAHLFLASSSQGERNA